MLPQLMVGGAATVAALAFHAFLMAVVSNTVRRISASGFQTHRLLLKTLIISATGALLIFGHFLEVLLWAFTYALVDAAPPDADVVYFAFVNYTTLGYGDILPVDGWRLLGPMTALNGILLIGWSTAVTFDVLRRTGLEQRAS